MSGPTESSPPAQAAPRPEGGGVKRLLDMLVEEVSLVDRAANNHRFLVVKKESGMSKKKPPATEPPAGPADAKGDKANKDPKPKKPAKPAAPTADETAKAGKAPKKNPDDEEEPAEATPASGKKTTKVFPPKKKPAGDADEEEEEEQEEEPEDAPVEEEPAGKPPKKPAAKDENGVPGPGEPDDEEDDDDESPYSITLACLESLTQAVEIISESPDEQGQFATVAQQLRAAADAISAAAGVEPEERENEEPDAEPSRDGLAASIQELLTRMASFTQALAASTNTPGAVPTVTTETQAPPDLAGTLDQVSQSMKAIETAVRTQSSRLAAVEKRVGAPNSQPAGERGRASDEDELSWPMDMNRLRDRGNVKRATSFHDI